MIQVVEKWICTYKPYNLLSIHIKKHDPLSLRSRQRLSVLCRRPIHTATTGQAQARRRHVPTAWDPVGCRCRDGDVSLSLNVNRPI
jgi:hypothetical protein